ncbi:MAG: hypothetical protein LBB62_05515, partial [Proteiniphilum sp.]|nr:hypothetical protein [Proteiniphilum sp.]
MKHLRHSLVSLFLRYSLSFLFMTALLPDLFAQNYAFEYDVEFFMNVNEGRRRRYYNTMYYQTAFSSGELELSDFSMFREENFKRVRGDIKIPVSKGPITQIRVVTDRQVRVVIAFVETWNDDYNESGDTYRVQLYNGSSNVYEFDLSNSIPDWGVFTGGGARARISA